MRRRVEVVLDGKTIAIEAGHVARQADGAVWVQCGDTVVLVTAVGAWTGREGIDFFPLTVDYQERAYAAGKIPGSFFRREGRPHEKETLTSRLIDRPLRPLFPKGYRNEVQVIATVLSADPKAPPDTLAIVGASAALALSGIPFLGPIGGVRMARVGSRLVINPSYAESDEADLDLVVAATEKAVVMVEGALREIPEDVVVDAIAAAHEAIRPLIAIQRELAAAVGKPPRAFTPPAPKMELMEAVQSACRGPIRELAFVADKEEQRARRQHLLDETVARFPDASDAQKAEIRALFDKVEKEEMRRLVLLEGRRADGRRSTELRAITCEVGVLPRTHGSAIFTRGQTQALVTTTLGTKTDEQRLDDLEGDTFKRFMLHYNFPPSSVGEVRFLRGPGRREIGHGALAERAIQPVLPTSEQFPYTIRIVSDILESNGSSSMASVCGASLALMDAGAPVRAAVGGVAMGLIMEGDKYAILTDIQGIEDHLGDMDFKVTGTRTGVTALQMDIKIQGVTPAIMREALAQARAARFEVLDAMNKALASPRPSLSPFAPRIVTIKIPVDKIREIIGPGGKVVRGIQDETGVKIDIADDGTISVASSDGAAAERALSIISKIVEVPEVGKVYQGKVVKIMEFGAFVEILPGTDGLLHVSQISDERVKRVEDVLKQGDEVLVKVIEIDKAGKIRLSRRELMRDEQAAKDADNGKQQRTGPPPGR